MRSLIPSGHQGVADVATAVLLALLACLELGSTDLTVPAPVAYSVATLMGLSLVVRRRHPLLVLTVVMVLFAIEPVLYDRAPEVLSEGVILMVAIYSCAVHASRGAALAGLGVAFAVGLMRGLVEPSVDVASAVVDALWVFPAFGVGLLVRTYERRAVSADLRAELAAETERLRIAREMHDVVAHGLGVMVLHARGGRRHLDSDPESARRAFDTISSVGEQALAEMRGALGVLRSDGGDSEPGSALTPAPGLGALPELLDTFRSAGLACTADVDELRDLPAGLELALYRIVQECLTNSLRHGGMSARVRLEGGTSALCLEVVDHGGGTDLGTGSGNGLVGIRERAEMFGGSVEAGPTPRGGHRVRVTVPLPAGSA